MIGELLQAADSLATVLEQENAALARLDFTAVAAGLSRKQQVLSTFTMAQAFLTNPSITTETHPELIDALHPLTVLVHENRRLLERGLAVQARVIAVIARAVPRAIAADTAGYRAGGAPAGVRRPLPMALSARA